jgi:tRNA dimethylallyltransferase
MKPILTIVGPTCVGKTNISINLAKELSGEIISADSRQIYKYLDIGTAKPTAYERRQIPFHFIDFIDPAENYSCGQFARDAEEQISEILDRHQTPLVCGGTGLYIQSLFKPLHKLPSSDPRIKKRLVNFAKVHGAERLYHRLEAVDPQWAAKISFRDTQRIIRGLEVYEITGNTLSSFLSVKRKKARYCPCYIGITLPRAVLYDNIDLRYDRMIAQGLIEEVTSIIEHGYKPNVNALRTIGYKEIIEFLQGLSTREQAVEKAKQHTRNLAKRQLTWFKKIPNVHWFSADDPSVIRKILTVWQDQAVRR